MEILLAIIVASAVIFFGALISMGNERQKKAIDSLRDQVVLWAVQDISIKRERLARDVRVDDPLDWFSKMASKVVGRDLHLQVLDVFNDPQALVCDVGDDTHRLVFTPLHPNEVSRISHRQRSVLSHFAKKNPLLSLPRKVLVYELSVLNGGILFDLELSLAWKGLTDQSMEQTPQLWIYKIG